MKAGDVFALRGGRRVVVRSSPRRIAGGEVVEVAWQADNLEMKLSDGSVHPAHRAGWAWEAAKHLRLMAGRYIAGRAHLREVEEAMVMLRAAAPVKGDVGYREPDVGAKRSR